MRPLTQDERRRHIEQSRAAWVAQRLTAVELFRAGYEDAAQYKAYCEKMGVRR